MHGLRYVAFHNLTDLPQHPLLRDIYTTLNYSLTGATTRSTGVILGYSLFNYCMASRSLVYLLEQSAADGASDSLLLGSRRLPSTLP